MDAGPVPVADAGPDEEAICLAHEVEYHRQLCLEDKVKQMVADEGPLAALCYSESLILRRAVSNCHLLGHYVGEALLAEHEDWVAAFSACPEGCQYGCHHGVLEGYVAQQALRPDEAEAAIRGIAQEVADLCEGLSARDEPPWSRCVHGLGHGLVASGYLSLETVVSVCEGSGDASFAITCLGGAFMEWVDRYLELAEAELLEAASSICPDFGNWRHRQLCAGAVGEGFMWFTSMDLERSNEMCGYIGDFQEGIWCREGAREGRTARGLTADCD